jgi:epoxyqueuosine reductase
MEELFVLTSEKVKKYAKQLGADLVGITSMDRFEGAPKEQDPRYIFPDAKSCIVLAFRIPRGYLRGIEEGTFFSTYTSMGYAGINEVYGPIVLRELCCYLEDNGSESVPLPNIYLRPSVYCDKSEDDPAVSVPVAEGLPAPDVMIDMRVAAYAAGLGEFGWSKVFLTPEFGPLQRFVALLTDAELEPDPIFEGHICDRCKSCCRMCTGQAISKTESDSITIAGHVCEYAKIDLFKCSIYYRGGDPKYNPFIATGTKEEDYNKLWFGSPKLEESTGIEKYMRHGSALEGARGCMRECYNHLEQTGRLTKKFNNKFRKHKPWCIDREKVKNIIVGKKKSNDNTLL